MKEVRSKLKPHDGVIIAADPAKFKEARISFGSQEKAASALGLSSQTIVSNIETQRHGLTDRNYSLMMLIANQHPNYELKARRSAKSIEDLIAMLDSDEVLADIAGCIVEIRAEFDLNQTEMADFLSCSALTVNSYENGSGKASERFYGAMLLIFDKHPHFKLKKR